MKRTLILLVALFAMQVATAQQEVDFPQLEKVSPWSVSLEGSVYQKRRAWTSIP